MGENSNRERTVVYQGTDREHFEGYVVLPAGNVQRPAVLLAHDWSGLNAGTRTLARRIAELGHPCFAVDVYGAGVRGDELGDNTALMAPLLADRRRLRARLLAGVRAAASLPEVNSSPLAAVGCCFGGLCALDLARAALPEIVAAVSIHGGLQPPQIGEQPPIGARVLLLHGWSDPVAPPADVVAIARELTDAGADWQLNAYGHALHAFTFERAAMPERGIAYHPVAAARAWSALRSFLADTLQSPPP